MIIIRLTHIHGCSVFWLLAVLCVICLWLHVFLFYPVEARWLRHSVSSVASYALLSFFFRFLLSVLLPLLLCFGLFLLSFCWYLYLLYVVVISFDEYEVWWASERGALLLYQSQNLLGRCFSQKSHFTTEETLEPSTTGIKIEAKQTTHSTNNSIVIVLCSSSNSSNRAVQAKSYNIVRMVEPM